MKVLAVLYCYPPLLVPAAICYMKLMLGLREVGVDVEIVHIDPQTFQPPGVDLPSDFELAAQSPSDMVAHVIRSPETTPWMKLIKRLDPTRRASYRWIEPKKREWTYPALRALQRLDLDSYDVLLTCSQPHANHLVGLELQRRTGIPWVAYFSDPWTDSPYINYRSPVVRAYNRQLEDRILERADRVLYTCDEMRRLVLDHHPVLDESRTGCLPHAFVPAWYEQTTDLELGGSGGPRLLQTGSFYGPRTPAPLVEALSRLRSRSGTIRLGIDIFGGMGPEHIRDIEVAGLSEVLRLHGMIPYLDTLALMRQSDGLILVDAPVERAAESVFLPSKLIDYLGAGKPIVAVTPEHGATARVVREVGGTVCALERPEELDAVLDAFERGDGLRPPDPVMAGEFEHTRVGRRLVTELEQLLMRRPADSN